MNNYASSLAVLAWSESRREVVQIARYDDVADSDKGYFAYLTVRADGTRPAAGAVARAQDLETLYSQAADIIPRFHSRNQSSLRRALHDALDQAHEKLAREAQTNAERGGFNE
jgi:hypothetical protein